MRGVSTRGGVSEAVPKGFEGLAMATLARPRESSWPGEARHRSAEHDGEGEASFAGFFVLAVHLFGGLGESHHGRIEIDAVPGRDLVAGDRVSGPGLDG